MCVHVSMWIVQQYVREYQRNVKKNETEFIINRIVQEEGSERKII